MKLLNKLERKFGRYAIRNLMSIIVGGNAAVFFVTLASPQTNIMGKIMLIPELVLRGEVWRYPADFFSDMGALRLLLLLPRGNVP